VYGRLAERSLGMDTTTGHWEMMGIVTERAFPTYPDGFPDDVIAAFAAATGRPVIGNVAASGTEIIQRLGEEHQRTGAWIVYTSADSVFQIAAHEATVPLEELYEACRVARGQLVGEHAVGRVIARPFEGAPGAYVRTPRRHDFSLLPPRPNHLERLRERGVAVYGVGKIGDIFAGQDVDTSRPTTSNGHGIAVTTELLRTVPDRSFVFVNLVETDMLWGHRNDPRGFADALEEFDAGLPEMLAALRHGDLLILTSDHGCDPTTPSTDHSREHALLLAHMPGAPMIGRRHDGDTFADVGATVMRVLTHEHDAALPGTPVL
jgi:phosphopentomutase